MEAGVVAEGVGLGLVDKLWSSVEVICNPFISHGKFEYPLVLCKLSHNLHTHWSTLPIEANRQVNHRDTSQSCTYDHLHPSMIGIHLFAIDGLRPMDVNCKWKYLSGGQNQQIVFIK